MGRMCEVFLVDFAELDLCGDVWVAMWRMQGGLVTVYEERTGSLRGACRELVGTYGLCCDACRKLCVTVCGVLAGASYGTMKKTIV